MAKASKLVPSKPNINNKKMKPDATLIGKRYITLIG
jgi:hypothetical protein